jgi:putative transposase
MRNRWALAYLDDVIVGGRTKREHDQRLDNVLANLFRRGFQIKSSKSQILGTHVQILGVESSIEGIRPQVGPSTFARVFRPHRTLRDLQRTLGLFNYVRKFVPDYTNRVHQVNALLKEAARGHPIVWTPRCTAALQDLVSYLETRPLLNHRNDEAVKEVVMAIGLIGFAGILRQEGMNGPEILGYHSKVWTLAIESYTTEEKYSLLLENS